MSTDQAAYIHTYNTSIRVYNIYTSIHTHTDKYGLSNIHIHTYTNIDRQTHSRENK